jgi:hypothetical protein
MDCAAGTDWGAIGAIGGAAFAAVAAGAAWATVWQGQKAWRASIRPDLRLDLQTRQAENDTRLTIFNAGGGTATEAICIIVGNGQRSELRVGDGYIPAGAKVTIQTKIPFVESDGDLDCLVGFKNLDRSLWYATRAGQKRLRRGGRWRGEVSQETVWKHAFPMLPYPSRKAGAEVVSEQAGGIG